MKSTSKTEQEMKEESAPTPENTLELSEYIESLTEREHDYGTCVYAMSLAAAAAFNMVASKLGVTGFQASCADMDILSRTRGLKGPWMFIKGEDFLYPQYDPAEKLEEARENWSEWLTAEAKKKIEETDKAHPNVLEHWAMLAYPTVADNAEFVETMDKARFLRNTFTPEFVEQNAEQFKRFGINDVYFTTDQSPAMAESCKLGCSYRLDMPVSLDFTRDIGGIKTRWSIDTELPHSSGESKYRFDFDKLSRLEAEAVNPAVKQVIHDYIADATKAANS